MAEGDVWPHDAERQGSSAAVCRGFGLEKSKTSEHFVEAGRRKLNELMKRTLKDIPLAAMLVDGAIFQGQHLIVAIGIDRLGNNIVLGLRQGDVCAVRRKIVHLPDVLNGAGNHVSEASPSDGGSNPTAN